MLTYAYRPPQGDLKLETLQTKNPAWGEKESVFSNTSWDQLTLRHKSSSTHRFLDDSINRDVIQPKKILKYPTVRHNAPEML